VNPSEARDFVLTRPQFLPAGVIREKDRGVLEIGQWLLQALGGGLARA